MPGNLIYMSKTLEDQKEEMSASKWKKSNNEILKTYFTVMQIEYTHDYCLTDLLKFDTTMLL